MISVFIPTYNSERYLSETLDSVLSQTYTDFEILCVDDESTDRTPLILKEYSAKDSRIKPFFKKNQGSVPYAWLYIFPHIRGEFTLYMSHDDLLSPDALELMLKKYSDTIDCVIPEVRFFETDINCPEKKYEEINLKYHLSKRQSISGEEAFAEMIDYSIPGFGLWRTALIYKEGMSTTSFNSDELMQRLWVKNARRVAFSEGVFGYRQSSHSIVKGCKPSHLFSLDTNLQLYRQVIQSDYISADSRKRIQYNYFKALVYLSRMHKKFRENMSDKDNEAIEHLKTESFKEFVKELSCPMSLRGLYYLLISIIPEIVSIRRS